MTKKQLIEELERLRKHAARLEEEKTGHKDLEEVWRRYEFIVNTSRDFLSLIDRRYTYVAANIAYCIAHSKKNEEIVSRCVSEIWGEEVFNSIIRGHLDKCFAGNEVHYQALFTFAGIGEKFMDVTYYPYRSNGETVTHAVVVSRDITDQKAAEDELLALKKAVETMQLGVTITDKEGKILYTNPADANMHGYPISELKGKAVRILAPEELWRTRLPESLKQITSWRRECVNVRNNGSRFPVQLMSDVVNNQDGEPIGIVTTCEDITERKRAEEQIQRQVKRLTTLREIDMLILSSLDLRVILTVLLNHLMNHLNIDAAAIMLLNPHTLTLEYAEGRGFRTDGFKHARFKLGEGLAGRVALERGPLCITDLLEEDMPDVCTFLKNEELKFYHGLPLIAKGHVKGTLEIFQRSSPDIGADWMDFMETLAGQAAIAIDNSTMFRDLEQSNLELSLAYDTTLDGWSKALDLRDKETEGHSQRVTDITLQIAHEMGIMKSELVHIRRGALLHDIGKMGIPDNILLKPGPLSNEEWKIMKLHPVYAYDMLSPIHFLKPALDIPYCHHEKWDGTGYPRGLKGEKIPLAARIFMIADVWDALCSARSYRPAYPREKALEYIQSLKEVQFDPEVLKVFMDMELQAGRYDPGP